MSTNAPAAAPVFRMLARSGVTYLRVEALSVEPHLFVEHATVRVGLYLAGMDILYDLENGIYARDESAAGLQALTPAATGGGTRGVSLAVAPGIVKDEPLPVQTYAK